MYAVIETGGKQVKVTPGQYIDIEKLPKKEGEKISLDKVLMLLSQKESKVGNPYLKGAVVNGQVIRQAKKDKVIVYKMRPKKGTRKKQGHRQFCTRLFIESIDLDGKPVAKAEQINHKIKVSSEEYSGEEYSEHRKGKGKIS